MDIKTIGVISPSLRSNCFPVTMIGHLSEWTVNSSNIYILDNTISNRYEFTSFKSQGCKVSIRFKRLKLNCMKSICFIPVNQVFKTRFTIRDSKETSCTLSNDSIVLDFIPFKAEFACMEFVHLALYVLFDREGCTVSDCVIVFFNVHNVDVLINLISILLI